MKVLVCGGRDFSDRDAIKRALDPIGVTLLIHGGAPGADMLAASWAHYKGIHTARVNALWDIHGKFAGPARNAAMLLLEPQLVVAFPGGRGTANMVRLAKADGRRVIEVAPETMCKICGGSGRMWDGNGGDMTECNCRTGSTVGESR